MPSPGTSLSAPRPGRSLSALGALCLARTASFAFPMPLVPLPEHKNPDFVLETPENGGFRPQKRTKTSILCSKSPKMRVPKGKSAQKPRYCARNARKRGFRRPKAHKNPDFVLEMPKNGGSRPQKSTKTSILCSKRQGLALGRATVAFLQITAHASKTQMSHNQIINF